MTLRPRRLRKSESIRRMVRETVLTVDDLIYPLFVMEGTQQKIEVPSMPGCYRYSLDELLQEIEDAQAVGIQRKWRIRHD
jgi:porphobilinogen synthase